MNSPAAWLPSGLGAGRQVIKKALSSSLWGLLYLLGSPKVEARGLASRPLPVLRGLQSTHLRPADVA